MRRILLESLVARPLTQGRPPPEDGMLAELAGRLDQV
jgi:hypothetical protein